MKDNELKEKIRKNIKEEIAISNIRKEFGMKTNKNKKVIYVLSSICAVFILGIGIFVGVNKNLLPGNTVDIGKTDANDGVELNINKIKDMSMTSLDADVKTIELENLPEEFTFMESLVAPAEYQLESSYMVNVRSNRDIAEYDVIHDYVFNYRKDSSNDIKIAFSSKFMLDSLRVLESEEMQLLFNGELKPIIIKKPESDDLKQLILPIRTY